MRPFQSVYFAHSIADLFYYLQLDLQQFTFSMKCQHLKNLCFCEESQLTTKWTEMGQPEYS